jgi:predicted HicB family RNase H-like nuclease
MKDLMKYKNFTSTVHFSAEDEVFYGKVIGIDDSITFEGQSVKELKKAFKEAIDDYLLLCAQAGKDPHKSYKGSFNVRIKPEIHKKAAYKSMQLGISLNQFVEQAITKSISKDKT